MTGRADNVYDEGGYKVDGSRWGLVADVVTTGGLAALDGIVGLACRWRIFVEVGGLTIDFVAPRRATGGKAHPQRGGPFGLFLKN